MAKLRLSTLESRDYKYVESAGLPCVLCGREVNESKAKWVFVCDGGSHITDDPASEQDDAGFMGAYPIGPYCHRKNRKVLAPFVEAGKAVTE